MRPWLGNLAWEILPRPIWAGWAGPDPIFFGGGGWGGVGSSTSNRTPKWVSLIPTRPPTSYVTQKKTNYYLEDSLEYVYIYMQIFPHTFLYIVIYFHLFSNRFLYLVLIFVAICSYMFHNIVSYCLIYVPICFDISAIYSYGFSNIFK